MECDHPDNINKYVKTIVNSIKYLKKSIKKIPKDNLTPEVKQKLFVKYEELVDIIIQHIK